MNEGMRKVKRTRKKEARTDPNATTPLPARDEQRGSLLCMCTSSTETLESPDRTARLSCVTSSARTTARRERRGCCPWTPASRTCGA
jgi:hypothetical protein